MNIAIRKLAMLEKSISEQEERSKIEGLVSCPTDLQLKNQICELLNKLNSTPLRVQN